MAEGKRGCDSWQYRVWPGALNPGRRGLLERELVQLEVRVLIDEVAKRPVVREKGHGLVQLVRPEAHARRHDEPRRVPEGGMGLDPAQEGPRRLLEPRLRAVFRLQAVLDDLELQGANRREEGRPGWGGPRRERLDDT